MKKVYFIFLFALPHLLFSQINDSTQRQVKLQGAVNVRDLGGYLAADGKHVKWGKLYRSAEINNLSTADLDTLEKRKINLIFDFRGPSEVATAQDKIPLGAQRISLPYGSEDVGDRSKMMGQMMKSTNGDSIMLPFYTNIQSFGKRYQPLFQSLMNETDSAILFHCTAGKDRTGIAAALILYALGVDVKTIMEDYLASNYYRQKDNERMKSLLVNTYHMNEEVVKDVVGVKQNYLIATFSTIEAEYGSINNYLSVVFGLDKKALKKLRKNCLI